MNLVAVTLLAVLFCYTCCMVWLILGWSKDRWKKVRSSSEKLSVIIPVRNEEQNLPGVLKNLLKNSKNILEIIIVNDHSQDETLQVIPPDPLIKIINLPDECTGKKNALEEGIKAAKGLKIVTTDADVTHDSEWCGYIAGVYEEYSPEMIIMPVLLHKETSLWDHLQSLEIASLTGITFAAAQWKAPILCNGANLSFHKKSFSELGGYESHKHIASGDDMFLLHEMYRAGKKIIPVKNSAVIAYASPLGSFKKFLHQRIRWGGKSLQFTNKNTLLIGSLLILMNLSLFFCLLFLIIDLNLWKVVAVSFLIKGIFDFLFLFLVTTHFKKTKLLKYFLIGEILYPVYLAGIIFFGIFVKPEWKGRRI